MGLELLVCGYMQYNRYTASFINPRYLVIDSNIEVRAELELHQVLTKDGSVTGAFLHVYSLIINVQSSPPISPLH